MICCPNCGSRAWKAEAELERWRTIALAVLVKHGGYQGHSLLVGTGPTGTLRFIRDKVKVRVYPHADAIEVRWDSPPVNGEGA